MQLFLSASPYAHPSLNHPSSSPTTCTTALYAQLCNLDVRERRKYDSIRYVIISVSCLVLLFSIISNLNPEQCSFSSHNSILIVSQDCILIHFQSVPWVSEVGPVNFDFLMHNGCLPKSAVMCCY